MEFSRFMLLVLHRANRTAFCQTFDNANMLDDDFDGPRQSTFLPTPKYLFAHAKAPICPRQSTFAPTPKHLVSRRQDGCNFLWRLIAVLGYPGSTAQWEL
mmetsp:Transcript_13332/g.42492  ORF Transcript_13332/g.42492 Transcript_13332/m.42492 type:complete len:100 (+) Transcript_13332:259-558(+)